MIYKLHRVFFKPGKIEDKASLEKLIYNEAAKVLNAETK